ncbi:MAG: patatin-like phospholipase family protein [Gammaproteobacteria bacterium]|nr:patatin-like phospholipase family protein [Gammaproteobacteria bacterium]MDH3370205.1 patatin-like phospholipase family protein [Gammaproteobacteria bacterium]MDH3405379.1 patatin-like phospholipase family protein [Gammaproteobacteria bacterium]MDH3562045.1 patatin-like phospholipase family protein [Gammaproteobacteria bacterium]MDH5486477.1 patatin-like phospholipase family protein [Gammaproteobacteria bacterium]
MKDEVDKSKVGLILAGGGARAAYQVGVLKAIAEMLPRESPNPFPILCGSSAGAINATTLAIYATRFQEGVRRLNYVWRNFSVHQVFRADTPGVIANGLRWAAALMLGGLGRRNPHALLDRAPLRRLLKQTMPCARIQKSIDAGALHALSVTASGYDSGQSVTFFQGVSSLGTWRRARRVGSVANITIDHLMASSAIPFVFSAEKINREYFGDGSMRQIAPISPALHLGANRVLVVGVRYESPTPERGVPAEYPSLAQIAGHVLNSIFLDSLEADLERLQRINKTISLISTEQLREGGVALRNVDVLVISPSEDIEKIAARHAHHLPRAIRFLLRGLGAFNRNGSNLVSYLLFEKPFCRELISLGHRDAMHRREEILRFLEMETA